MPASYLDLQKQNGYGEMINKVIEAKRAPIRKKEEEKKKEQLRISVLGDLQKELTTLRNYSARLYGADSIFNEYKFIPESPEILVGSARKPAVPGSYEVRVLQVASAHRLSSRDLGEGENLPASDFTLRTGGKNWDFRFGGGSVAAFKRLFERPEIQKVFSVASVRKGAGQSVLVLAAEKAGAASRIELMKDSGKLMDALGLFADAARAEAVAGAEAVLSQANFDGNGLAMDRERFVLEPGAVAMSRFSRDLALAPGERIDLAVSWRSLAALAAASNQAGKAGDRGIELATGLELPLRDRIAMEEDVFILPVLRSFDQTRLDALQAEREAQRRAEEAAQKSNAAKPAATNGQFLKVRYLDGESIAEKVFSLPDDFAATPEGSNAFSLSDKDLTGGTGGVSIREFQFFNRNTHHQLRASWPRRLPAPPAEASNASPWKPAREISPAKPARLEYRGVVVEREGNAVSDLIDGVTLDLRSASEKPARFRVEWNEESIFNNLINFVGQYNLAMEQINVLINSDKPPPDAKEEVKNRWGLFRGEISMTLLKDKLRRIAIDPHPTSRPEVVSLLSQAGISPVFIMGNPNDLNIGKLDMKEEEAKKAFRANPDLVGELFAFDTDGDRMPDTGVAVDTGKLARSYDGRGAVLDIQRETCKRRIEQLEKEMKHEEAQVESYRKKLVNDFSELEKAQKEMERMGKYLEGASGGK